MSNTATNTVTPLGAPFLRTTHMAVVEVTEAYAEDRSKMKMKNLLC